MREAVYQGPRDVRVATARPSAGPAPGEVVVDVEWTGLCGTDLHIFHGHMDTRVAVPTRIGHETVGRVSSLGEGVTGWHTGDPVSVIPYVSCGECPACGVGDAYLCHRLLFLGIDAPGALTEQWTVPAGNLVALPADCDLRTCALTEPTAVAVHDVRRVGVSPGDHVLVVGGGPVGLLIALVAGLTGAAIVLSEPSAERRRLARSLGIDSVSPSEMDEHAVLERTCGAGFDVVFEVSGSASGVDLAVRALRVKGRLCLVAIHPVRRELDLHRFFWRELTMVGARLYERADFERAAELLSTGVIEVAPLITRTVPMGDVLAAFEALDAGQEMKVLVSCRA